MIHRVNLTDHLEQNNVIKITVTFLGQNTSYDKTQTAEEYLRTQGECYLGIKAWL